MAISRIRIVVTRYTVKSKQRSLKVQRENAAVRGLLKRLKDVGVKT